MSLNIWIFPTEYLSLKYKMYELLPHWSFGKLINYILETETRF
jgi:hypothetical protein